MRDLILAIETSNPGAMVPGAPDLEGASPGVTVGRMDGERVEVLGVEPVRARGEGRGRGGDDDDLIPAIDRVFARLGGAAGAREGLARVAVSAGPGGYTSLRVACCAGKMLAEATGAACVRVPTGAVVLESVDRAVRDAGPIAIALASKGEGAWVVEVESRKSEAGSDAECERGRVVTALELGAIFDRGVRTLIADRHLPASMRTLATERAVRVVEPVFSAAACLRLGARLPPIDPALLAPIYPREPEAVTLWRERKK